MADGSDALPHAHFCTDDLPEAERFEAFRRAVAASHLVERPADDDRVFRSTMDLWQLGEATIVSGRQFGLTYARPARKIVQDGLDSFAILLLKEGHWHGEAGARSLTAGAGQAVIFDRAMPMRARTSDNFCVVLTLSRPLLGAAIADSADVHGRLLDGSSGRLFADHLLGLVRELPALRRSDVPGLLAATVALAKACLAGLPSSARQEDHHLRHVAARYVDRALTDPDLSPQRIADALAVSRSALYRAFERHGGVRSYVRARRLEAVHVLLGDPAEGRSIAELADDFGFASNAHFSRAFRERFGFTPREARQRIAPIADAGPEQADATAAYRTWTAAVGRARRDREASLGAPRGTRRKPASDRLD